MKHHCISLLIRLALFALLTWAATLDGHHWTTFVLGGFWGVFALAYGSRITYQPHS